MVVWGFQLKAHQHTHWTISN